MSAARPIGEIRTQTAEAIRIPALFAPEIDWFRCVCDCADYRLEARPTKSHERCGNMSVRKMPDANNEGPKRNRRNHRLAVKSEVGCSPSSTCLLDDDCASET